MANDYSMDLSKYVDLMRSHHEASKQMAALLGRSPLFEQRALRMSHCSTLATGLFCPRCKTFHTVRASLCRDRLCPNCGWILSRHRAFALMQAIEAVQNVYDPVVLHVVLTMRHTVKDSLSDQLDRMLSGFVRLIRSKRLSEGRIGYVRSLEVKYNKSGFHPHIHLLLVMDSDYFTHMVKHAELVQLWRKACGFDYNPVVWIKTAYDKNGGDSLSQAVYECVKYCIKTTEWSHMPVRRLEEAAISIHGRSLFRVGGGVLRREFNEALKRVQDNLADVDETRTCKRCGGQRYDLTLNAEVTGYGKVQQ